MGGQQLIYFKTAAGTNEVQLRSRGLPPRLRTMLIMVDGVRTFAQLDAAAVVLGAPHDFLLTLLQLGLVDSREPASISTLALTPANPSKPAPDLADRSGAGAEAPVSAAERFRAAQKFMNDSAVDALGLRAFFFTLKLEKAFGCEDLGRLLPEFRRAIGKANGEDAAELLLARARSLLG